MLPTIDGLLAVIASIAEQSGAFPTARDKRLFGDNCGKAIPKLMQEARERGGFGAGWGYTGERRDN